MEKRKFSKFKPQRVKSYQFIAVPKMLFSDPQFTELSLEARWLYIQMLDRASLSAENAEQGDFVDENGDIYIIYSNDEIAKELHCGKNYVTKFTAELVDFGLIEKKHQGQGKPTVYYVMDFATLTEETGQEASLEASDTAHPFSESLSEGIKNPSGWESRIPLGGKLESPREGANKNEYNKNKYNNIPPSPLSPHGIKTEGREELDPIAAEADIKNQIDFEVLVEKGYDSNQIMEIVRLMTDMLCRAGPTKLGTTEILPASMEKRMHEITCEHVEYVLDTMSRAKDVRNPRAYLLALLYNAPTSLEFSNQLVFNSG